MDNLTGQIVRIVRAVTKWIISNTISLRSIAPAVQLTDPTGRQREQWARGLQTPARLVLRAKTFSPSEFMKEGE